MLILAGGALALMAIAIALAGGAVGLGRTDPAGLAFTATTACVGLGALVLGIAGHAPLSGRPLRIGLIVLGVGLVAVCASAIPAGIATTDPLSSLPIVALAVIGFGLTPIGWLVAGIALLADGPRSRIVGVLVLVGAALIVAGVVAGGGGDPGRDPFARRVGSRRPRDPRDRCPRADGRTRPTLDCRS